MSVASPVPNPQLAYHITSEQLEHLKYPVYASPKVDGIRALIEVSASPRILTRSRKPVPNPTICSFLESVGKAAGQLPELQGVQWLDAELQVGDFNTTASEVMSQAVGSLPRDFQVHIFDVLTKAAMPASLRLTDPKIGLGLRKLLFDYPKLQVIQHRHCCSAQDLATAHADYVAQGYEGTVARHVDSFNNPGRANASCGSMTAIVDYRTAEGTIVGFLPLERNLAASKLNERGYKQKDSKAAHMQVLDRVGSIILRLPLGETVRVGTGLSDVVRVHYWRRQDELVGQLVKFKYKELTPDGIPRHPVFLGLRHPDDT